MTFRACVLTLFPEMFPGPLGSSIPGRALKAGLWELEALDIRDFATDRHRTVDDTPFGGGAGMVLRPDVVDAAIEAGWPKTGPLVYLTPRGRVLDQELVREFAAQPSLTILCGRYEGVDERVLEAREVTEVSLGDFVLSGGEPAALALLDAVVRLLPGALGATDSLDEESFENGLLEYPHYTRPAVWQGRSVPEVLLSGHHQKVSEWRKARAEAITQTRRPDLWARYTARRAEFTNTAVGGPNGECGQ
ncbi:tRNA (guanosine(37)-N1)-methyltransferase TrmD [Phaeovibrio sulfidiphilus]|uniref:tRNA (guanine-N(1)-)-methyltransferase n=1 Tax=Phaeovibrio sulfidiphilus TaxID=1220600 RepID=A0A8J6YLK1_9PROT|nr:tRNA (guanosine(37)-N1)-methyltransferase TrmD [Phaeovibrio sulfidiphilus]MBE1237000.1 tRNA (guanosine(37)-N1)-methyltransferase TrmD [Phaeovibrio sulfidiphilus]